MAYPVWRSRVRVCLGALLLSALPLYLIAQAPSGGRGQKKSPPARRNFLISRAVPDPAAVERGQKLFVADCGFCHGSKANGGENGPDLVRSVLALQDEGGDQIGPVILKGRTEKGMPAFALTSGQIKDIAAFLRARQQAAIDRNAYKIQNVATGDPKKGKAYFESKCGSCHSPEGDLKGIAGKYDPVALQSRFLYPESHARRGAGGNRIPTPVTVTLASGRRISGELEYIDDFNVALRDSSGEYHSFERGAGVKVEVKDPLAGHLALLKQYTDQDMHNLTAYLVTLK
ncbi:MAG: c-type cytochrome [Bryobacterales bacterium]|nr:c-type cytochrome [Bryobacterales bacterium]